MPWTTEEVVAPVEDVAAPDTSISGPAETAAALPVSNQHVIGQVDGSQDQVGLNPCWGEAAKDGYRKMRCD